MAYNRNYNNGGNSSDYNRNYGNNNNYQSRNNGYGNAYNTNYNQPKKKSGAKFTKLEDGGMCVSAWRVSKGQLITLYARPYKGTKVTESKGGKRWANLFVTVTNKTTMQQTNMSALLDIDGKRLYLKEFNLIVTNAGRGGYFGKHLGK